MASVTFLTTVGGDGSTVTDDSNATTGLGNGGHRLRFIPCLTNLVNIANNTVTQATNAASSASSASSSAIAAGISATNANNSFISLDKRYLGAKSGDPSVDNQGSALLAGAIYWNTPGSKHRVYNGSTWSDIITTTTFTDNNFTIQDNVDSTKKVVFEISGVSSGTTRTLTLPNANGTFALTSDIPTVATDFLDSTFRISDNGDSTKKVAFEVSGITTGATRTLTVPNASGTLALTSDFNTTYALLNSPTFVGTPLAPTATAGTNTTQIATTAFVATAVSSKAPAANPTFTGTQTCPTIVTTTSDVGATTPTRVAVETASDSTIKWQTVANFFNKLGQVMHLNADRGRFSSISTMTNGDRLTPGKIYSYFNGWGVNSLKLPTVVDTAIGDTITFVALDYLGTSSGWSASYPLTITCDANVYITSGASGESFIIDDSRVKKITFTCTNTGGSLHAHWAVG